MHNLRQTLPSANTLVVFEAAARCMSFTRAAGELGVSQAAVSRQIQALEAQLGRALFHRLHRALRLTPEGERLHAAVAMGLGHIAETVRGLRLAGAEARVTVSATVAFAAFWLMPRIGRFYAAHPGVEVRLLASDTPVDPRVEAVDVALRYGLGRWPDLDAALLFDEEIFPVCGPAYLDGRTDLAGPADLLDRTLLHTEVIEPTWLGWPDWLRAMDVVPPAKLPGPRFNSYTLVVQAAQAGQGMALGWHRLVAQMIEAGTLLRALPDALPARESYYLVVPEAAALSAEAAAFRDWLLAEAALER